MKKIFYLFLLILFLSFNTVEGSLIPLGNPTYAKSISSLYGMRKHPIFHKNKFHYGVDLYVNCGMPVYTTMDGFVRYAGYWGNYGLVVIIQNSKYITVYGHLSKIAVKSGTIVKRGNVIGLTGRTGLSTGCHLHYEIRDAKNTVSYNPIYFIYGAVK